MLFALELNTVAFDREHTAMLHCNGKAGGEFFFGKKALVQSKQTFYPLKLKSVFTNNVFFVV